MIKVNNLIRPLPSLWCDYTHTQCATKSEHGRIVSFPTFNEPWISRYGLQYHIQTNVLNSESLAFSCKWKPEWKYASNGMRIRVDYTFYEKHTSTCSQSSAVVTQPTAMTLCTSQSKPFAILQQTQTNDERKWSGIYDVPTRLMWWRFSKAPRKLKFCSVLNDWDQARRAEV